MPKLHIRYSTLRFIVLKILYGIFRETRRWQSNINRIEKTETMPAGYESPL
jgi:hypothetical protein